MAEGIDYAWGRPGTAAIKNAGKAFVVRYLSHDTTGKTLTLAEARDMTNAGIWLACVFEDTAGRMLNGKAAGVADATFAAKLAADVGMPAGRPIYFACDTEITTTAQTTKVMEYLDGVISVIGLGRTGMYGQYSVIKRAFDLGKIAFGWQTYAWSAGQWDSRAQLQQYKNEVILNGVDVDLCRSIGLDYGQWKIGSTPDMTISDTEANKIATAVLNLDDVIKAPDGSTSNPYWALKTIVYDIAANVRALQAAVGKIGGADPQLADKIVSGVLTGLNAPALVETIVAGVVAQLPPAPVVDHDLIAQKVLDGLARRMES